MSSSATLTPRSAVTSEQWRSFCDRHRIEHSPNTVGGNVFYSAAGVEVWFGESRQRWRIGDPPPMTASSIYFGTFWMGDAIPEVARLAQEAKKAWGGRLRSDPEIAAALKRITMTPEIQTQ